MRNLFYVLLCLLVVTSLGSCKKDSSSGNTGTLRMHLTDGPIDDANVKAVFITVTDIQINVNGNWNHLDGFNGPKTFNLMDLRDSNAVFLGQEVLPAGSYSEIRFILEAPDNMNQEPSNPGCYILYKDNTTQPLFVPSGSSSGFKAKGNFDVPVNGTVNIVADFDVRKSVVQAGNSGKFLLKPVIRIEALNQAGFIKGTLGNKTSDDITLYAYEDGTYNATEADTPSSGNARFPNAVTSATLKSDSTFMLAYLAPGKYDIAVAAYHNGGFVSVLGFIKDVTVQSKQTTTVTASTSTLSPTP